MSKIYIAYDARGEFDTDDAQVLVATSNLHEALEIAKQWDGVVYSYDEKGKELINETRIYFEETTP